MDSRTQARAGAWRGVPGPGTGSRWNVNHRSVTESHAANLSLRNRPLPGSKRVPLGADHLVRRCHHRLAGGRR